MNTVLRVTLLATFFSALGCSDVRSQSAATDASSDRPASDAPDGAPDGAAGACNGGTPSGAGGPCRCPGDCEGSLRCATESATGTPRGICLQGCTPGGDIPEGFVCRGNPGGTFLVRLCGDGRPACREGSVCRFFVSRSEQSCYPACTRDAQCEGGRCNLDLGACGPATQGASLGAACTRDEQCRSGGCFPPPLYQGGYCVSFCDTRAPACPDDGACALIGRNPTGTHYGQCFPRCTATSDCRTGYQCLRNGTDRLCFPMVGM